MNRLGKNFALLNDKQKEFISFVLSKYIEAGVDELDQENLPILLKNKYQSLEDAKEILGDTANISKLFIEFQEHLYPEYLTACSSGICKKRGISR